MKLTIREPTGKEIVFHDNATVIRNLIYSFSREVDSECYEIEDTKNEFILIIKRREKNEEIYKNS